MSSRVNLLSLLAACAVAIASGPGCTPKKPCGPSTCSGCCDSSGACQAGTQDIACGSQGLACLTCGAGSTCLGQICWRPQPGDGDGGDSGTGDAGADGGTDSGVPDGGDAGVADAGDSGVSDSGVACLLHDGGLIGNAGQEAEPDIAADGDGGLVAVWMATGNIAYAASFDRGRTWTASTTASTSFGTGDPSVTVDARGNFFAAWLDLGGTSPGIWVARFDRATNRFGAAVLASDVAASTNLDKPWMVVDGSDALIVSWLDVNAFSMVAARSTDLGATFARHPMGAGSLAYLCTDRTGGPTAPIYAAEIDDTGTGIMLARSTNGGVSWIEPSANVPGPNAAGDPPSCAARGNDVWIAYTTTSAEVRVLHSGNSGATWGTPTTASSAAPAEDVLHPRVLATPTGAVEVVYFQGVVNDQALVYRATSTDLGSTWSRVPFGAAGVLVPSKSDIGWWGDYLGAALDSSGLYVVHGDNRSTANWNHIRFAGLCPN